MAVVDLLPVVLAFIVSNRHLLLVKHRQLILKFLSKNISNIIRKGNPPSQLCFIMNDNIGNATKLVQVVINIIS